ncbi:Pectin lyase fold/virulence factor [Sesbania bispinosa]|nr:Pectin lyase fold/virulence factor [Sesbania bispinosa]
MDNKVSISTFALVILLVSSAKVQSRVVDVTKYGATSKGDITQALTIAWKEACTSTSPSKVFIPNGTYKLRQVNLNGPCKAPIEVQVLELLMAWAKLLGNKMIVEKNKNCKMISMNFGFNFLNNSIIKGITSKDSKSFHVNVLGCKNVTFNNFSITAPTSSPNTDGIHIGRSSGINITNSYIATGDDCISLGDGTRQITVLNVTCGPGHGISVGSLGKYPNEEPVESLTVRNCTLNNTDNGLRIKTWPGTQITSLASDFHFEDIIMVNVTNPVIIDQEYCPWNQCSKQAPSKIKISRVTFKDIKGTSATQKGVILICSSGTPCEDVELSDIDLTFNGVAAITTCANVKPTIMGKTPTCEA